MCAGSEQYDETNVLPDIDDSEWVREPDDGFFEKFTALSWQRENRRLHATREEESEKDKQLPNDMATPHSSIYKMDRKEWEDLYVEVLYTIRHKLGASSSGYAAYTQDLYDYAQEAFQISDDVHERLMTVAEEEKPPIPVLNVTVMEARDLEAKDPNGYSDPYCMLGIQTNADPDVGRRYQQDTDDYSPDHSVVASPIRRHPLKKFGASFKRRDRRERSNSESGVIPAKFIRTTTVKAQTLNPKWHEKFRLDLDDVRIDRLHLDIWDHDDETSVFDAARKLNEVSNLKGLGRYFKEIAQSARTSIGDNVDDFLGCVNIPLEEVSSVGVDRWFKLQGRSNRSNIQGKIRLKLHLGTREDRGMATGEDNWREVVEHQELIGVFIEHELRMHNGATYEWAGDLSQQALTILHQHAIQGDITELQQSMCQWIAYSRKHREVSLDYALLYQQLEELDRMWNEKEEALSMDEQSALAESFNLFADQCMELLVKHRALFPHSSTQAWHKLKFMLKCLALLYTSCAFKTCCPFRNELHVEVTNTLKKGTSEWFALQLQNCNLFNKTEEEKLRSLISFIEVLNRDLHKAVSHYNHLFESTVRVNFTVLMYKQLEKLLADEISRMFGLKVNSPPPTATVPASGSQVTKNPNSGYKLNFEASETVMFELFLVLREFTQFMENLPPDETTSLVLQNFHVYFTDILQRWFSVAKSKVRNRIYNAVELDKVPAVKPYLKYSTSAMDTVICFIQLKDFWKQLAWPDPVGSYPFINSIVQAISSGTVLYCNLCFKRLQVSEICNKEGEVENSEMVQTVVNNMEHVLETLFTLPDELEIEKVLDAIAKIQGQRTSDECKHNLYSQIQEAQGHGLSKINIIVESITKHMRPLIKKYVFHLAWAPEKLQPEKALSPLIEYLEKSLHSLHSKFLEQNFHRLLESIWRYILEEISVTARANIGKERPFFFERFSASLKILVDYFRDEGKSLPMDRIQNPLYQELEEELELHKADTAHLVELFYLQRLEDQSKLYHAPFGTISVNVYYDEVKQAVCVEVLSAKDLIPCDPNGLSDPFVILELVPKHLFPNCSVYKTKVHKKTLNPYFNEYVEWSVKPDVCKSKPAALSLVIMDHDFVGKNDFEGEAYVALSALPGVDNDKYYDGKPVDLVLMQTRNKSAILNALAVRTWDKDAVELLKQEKTKRS